MSKGELDQELQSRTASPTGNNCLTASPVGYHSPPPRVTREWTKVLDQKFSKKFRADFFFLNFFFILLFFF